jgi:hypothetical protein
MGKGFANRLSANCINKGLINDQPSGLNFLRTVNYHIVFSSPNCTQSMPGGFFSCGSSDLLTPPSPYTRPYPINYVAPSGSMTQAFAYGKSSSTEPTILRRLDGEQVYLTAADYAPLAPKPYCPAPYNIAKRAGPAFPIQSAFGSMQRRNPTLGNYPGRDNYDFLDASNTMPDVDRNVYLCETGDKRCDSNNWLIYSGQGNDAVLPIYTNCANPFLITTHWEQSETAAPYSPLGQDYLPFCDPIPARLLDGTIIGYYTGLCFSLIFGASVLAYGPFPQYLPSDPYSPLPPPKPPVDSHKAFYSVEIATFFRGQTTNANYPLGSPLLAKQRYWLYSGFNTPNWRFPFKFMCADSIYASNPFIIQVGVIGDTDKELTLNFSNQKVLITY